MTRTLAWLPFGALLVILPYPGTVAARLLFLLSAFLIAGAWRWKTRAGSPSPLPCKPALLAWGVVASVSLAYAVDPGYSMGELKNEVGYAMMALFAFFVIGQREDGARVVLRAAAVSAAVMFLWTTATWLENSGWNRMARHGDAGVVSTFVVTIVPALLCLALQDPGPFWRRLGAVLAAYSLFVVAITDQRAAWLALAVEVAVFVALLAGTGRLAVTRRQALVVVGVLLAAAVVAVLRHSLLRYGRTSLAMDSRALFWPDVMATILAHPWAGSGFGRQALKLGHPELIPAYNRELWHAHNVFLNYGLALGLPGMAALLALFAAWGRFFWRAVASPAGMAGLVLVIGVVFRNQFNDFFQRDMSLLFWSLVGLFAGLCLGRKEEDAS